MIRNAFASLCAVVLLASAGCGKPCDPHGGSVDGWCNGQVATNCRSTCADCIDEWKTQACAGQCSVVTAKPADGVMTDADPHIDQPKKWAICSPK